MALLVGWPCFRLSGHYYAIATVVVGEIGYLLVLKRDWVDGATGINILYVRSIGDSWLWLQFRIDKLPYHYAALAFASVAWLAAWLIEGSRWGFVWRAVKDDPVAARSLAVRIFPSKMAAAAISGVPTGIGGAIYAQACRLHRSGQRAVWAVVYLDPIAGGAGRCRHFMGAVDWRCGADPVVRADAILSWWIGERCGPDDLRG